MELWCTMENYVTMEKSKIQWKKTKHWYYRNNRGTKTKPMALNRKLWNIRFTKEKTWLITKIYDTLICNRKNMVIYQNN